MKHAKIIKTKKEDIKIRKENERHIFSFCTKNLYTLYCKLNHMGRYWMRREAKRKWGKGGKPKSKSSSFVACLGKSDPTFCYK